MKRLLLLFAIPALAIAGVVLWRADSPKVGRQPDGSFVVATGQRILPGTIAFDGRPIDIAMHPSGDFFAVLNQSTVFLSGRSAVLEGSSAKLAAGASFRGLVWNPSGTRLYASLSNGQVQVFALKGRTLAAAGAIELTSDPKKNPVPGGMAITRDGRRLYIACASKGVVAEVDTVSLKVLREVRVQQIPFEPKLTGDERTLVVSNWGGRTPETSDKDDEQEESGGVRVLVDRRGVASTGSVSIVNLNTGKATNVVTQRHPTGIAIRGNSAYVANAGDDSISEIDLAKSRVVRTIVITWGSKRLFGSMPTALTVSGDALYAADGGDNAVAKIDISTGKVVAFFAAGFFPTGIALSTDGRTAFVVNAKGNGSVRRTAQGKPGNAHDFQGTVSVIDLRADPLEATAVVARLNNWARGIVPIKPNLAVYSGAIQNVLYIIKENRTYDEMFGDLPQGDGDPSLAGLGAEVTPNHRALATTFTLFDNAYVSGTNSAEGHQWATQGLANDYIERFYAGYSRSYPYDGGDPMAYSSGGFIWDAAARKRKTIRVYGEFAKEELATHTPKPKTWLEAWEDRKSGRNSIKVRAATTVRGLKPYLNPEVTCWPLIMSDQWRADKFIAEYQAFSKADRVPNLMILTLPSDHTEGTTPGFPKPRSMVADNDLALGRVVEAISNSPQWKQTAIFVMEDDAQAGPDHVDGHRTVCLVISPNTKRGFVDSTLYTQISILRSIELMLGLDPMNRFDAVATPFAACFTDTPDFTPYTAKPNRVPLDDMNPPLSKLSGDELFWAKKSASLDWSDVDTADWYWLNRIVWFSLHGARPYPGDSGELYSRASSPSR